MPSSLLAYRLSTSFGRCGSARTRSATCSARQHLRQGVAQNGACLQLLRVQQALAVDVYHVEELRRELQALFRRHGSTDLSRDVSVPLGTRRIATRLYAR